jgi:ATP-binding cassette subfamily B protein
MEKQEKNVIALWQVTRGRRILYAGAMAGMALASLFIFAAPLLGKYAIDVAVEHDLGKAPAILAGLAQQLSVKEPILAFFGLSAVLAVLATAIGGVFHYLRGRWAAMASEAIVRQHREALYHRLHHLRAGFFDRADTGDLVQRCSSDIETLRVFLSTDVVEIGRAIILLLVVTPILFWLDGRLAWFSLCLMPFLVVFAYLFFVRVKQAFLLSDEAEGAMTAVLQENLTGIRVVRAFARQEYEIGKFAEHNREFRDLNNRLIRLMALYWGVSDLFAMVQIGIVLMAGAWWMMQGELSLGTLFAFMTYEAMVIWPIRHLGRVLTNTGKAVVSLGRIHEILGEPEESSENIPASVRAGGEIRIEQLNFSYEPDKPVIRDFSLHVPAGQTLAIIGAPGSGKSTLIRLLLRLYPYSSGSIKLDDRELRLVNRQWLRQQIGVVLQDPFLYSRTVKQNLLVGRPDAGQDQVQRACIDAAVHDSVSGFPHGYETEVGERGVTLSGGQRQRLALARALLKNPPVLVLDDSLSAVDSETEVRILSALEERKGRQTTIVIAHRLSSIRHADRIIVLRDGAIAQDGTHAELAAHAGPYRELHMIQESLDESIAQDLATEQVS